MVRQTINPISYEVVRSQNLEYSREGLGKWVNRRTTSKYRRFQFKIDRTCDVLKKKR